MNSSKPQIRFFDNYLAAIRNSVGSTMFRNLYASIDGKKKDILHNGELACAYYTSSVLKMFGLIGAVHATVAGAVRDMEASGWKRLKARTPRRGSVIVWMEISYANGETHRHIGFSAGNGKAISSSYRKRKVTLHHLTYNQSREIEAIYWHPFLDRKFADLRKSR